MSLPSDHASKDSPVPDISPEFIFSKIQNFSSLLQDISLVSYLITVSKILDEFIFIRMFLQESHSLVLISLQTLPWGYFHPRPLLPQIPPPTPWTPRTTLPALWTTFPLEDTCNLPVLASRYHCQILRKRIFHPLLTRTLSLSL